MKLTENVYLFLKNDRTEEEMKEIKELLTIFEKESEDLYFRQVGELLALLLVQEERRRQVYQEIEKQLAEIQS